MKLLMYIYLLKPAGFQVSKFWGFQNPENPKNQRKLETILLFCWYVSANEDI